MDVPWGHYARWSKPVTKSQILYNSTYMSKIIETESKWWLPGAGGGENGQMVFNGGQSFSFTKWNTGLDGGDGFITIWMYLIPLNCTLKNGKLWEFPGCQVVRTPHFHCWGRGQKNKKVNFMSCVFLNFIYLFIYLFLFLAVLGLCFCARAFSMRQAGATLHRGARASHYRGLSCCGAQAPDAQAQ